MFRSARLKLTAWYLMIILAITILFSIALYKVATNEIQKAVQRQEFLMKMYEQIYLTEPPGESIIAQLQDSEERLSTILIIINGWIFIVAGAAAYFLAGRTLKPIKKMVDGQNRFISDASHELKTPLTAQYTEIEVALRDKNLTLKQARQILSSNLEEVKNMQMLTNNLLRLSQIQQNGLKITMDKVSLHSIAADAVKRLAPLARAKNIAITLDENNTTIIGHKNSLVELFVILLDNAIKFSINNSKVILKFRKTDHKVIVTVTDYGVGISKSDLPQIFDRFYRADKSRSKNDISGYGLGLSIAKKIVVEHKGTISVKSEQNKETTFTITLPTAG